VGEDSRHFSQPLTLVARAREVRRIEAFTLYFHDDAVNDARTKFAAVLQRARDVLQKSITTRRFERTSGGHDRIKLVVD
jgi:hypothetical protein